ncbi:integrase domain-containing protein [Vibrio sp. JC009]|uniref:integrase domain-containing protein n=1 Tax=Vibrio sp. JC009 TaxID=2912314 RepID=UPI0023B0DA7E|nr:integrase domain-containing protein [Vibrio sp. JC009]WED21313.1 integrase domain-containing protein [Vibrio sp. JC009]
MAKSKGLTDKVIKQTPTTGKEYTLSDGDGLQLRVRPNGSKSWQFRYRHPHTNKISKMALGSYPALGLKDARKLTISHNEQVALGIDPKEKKEQAKQEHQALYEHTFKNIAVKWFEMKKPEVTPDYATDIWRSFELHIFPHLADTPISQITAPDTIEIMRPIEAKGSLETIKRLSQRLNEVMDYAVNHGFIHANPLSGIRKVFKKPKKEHMKALTPAELPELMGAIANASIKRTTRCLIEFQLHTMTRPSEAAAAEWSEFDLKAKVWTIPAKRMKKRREHRIPLTDQVLGLLEVMKAINGYSAFVFASASDPKKPSDSQTANMALKRMGFAGRLVSHGLRSLASTTLNQQGFESDLVEAALAHVDGNEVRAAYNRTDYLERRIPMMRWWSGHIEQASQGSLSMTGFKGLKVVG